MSEIYSKKLSEKSKIILSLIAEGHSDSQIVNMISGITYLDIFNAAEEAIYLAESEADYQKRVKAIKVKYPKTDQSWSPENDDELRMLFSAGYSILVIASHLQRPPNSIRAQLRKHGLQEEIS